MLCGPTGQLTRRANAGGSLQGAVASGCLDGDRPPVGASRDARLVPRVATGMSWDQGIGSPGRDTEGTLDRPTIGSRST